MMIGLYRKSSMLNIRCKGKDNAEREFQRRVSVSDSRGGFQRGKKGESKKKEESDAEMANVRGLQGKQGGPVSVVLSRWGRGKASLMDVEGANEKNRLSKPRALK